MKHYIVWSAYKIEGFITTDKQLAYEVRKSSDTNCYTKDGIHSSVGAAFCLAHCDEECTIQSICLGESQ